MNQGWNIKTFGEIAEIKGGKRVPKGYKLESKPTKYPYIRVTDFNDKGSVDLSEIHYVSEEVFAQIKNYTISSSDLYISIAGTIGKSGIIPEELDGANLTENACKLVFRSGIYPKFVYYFTKTEDFLKQAGLNTRVAAMPKLALSRLATTKMPIPPLSEQQRIVALLDKTFAALTKVHANAEQNRVNAREVFESVLREIFSGGEEWEEKTFGGIAENLDSQRVPVTKRDRQVGTFPYYGASGIVDYVDEYIFDEDLLLVSEDGANLLARTYPIAFSISGKTWVNNHAHVLRFENMATHKFVEYYLNSISLEDYVSGMAQPKLNQAMLNSIPVYLPKSLLEQHAIVARLDTLSAETKQLEEVYQSKLDAVEELRKSILQKAFEGEL